VPPRRLAGRWQGVAGFHGLYGAYGSSCVDGTVNDYLRSGELPDTDRTC
jgi:hypothetical protein